jgi:acyl carrier protein
MSSDAVLRTIADIIQQKFEHDGEVTAATVASDVEGWDSVAHVELIIEVEQSFGIRLTTGEAADLPNVGALLAAVERHLQRKGS